MGTITISQRDYDIDCIAFDKDDTLIEFDALWGPRTKRWVKAITTLPGLADETESALYKMIGYSPEQDKVCAESPLAIASIEALSILMAGVLCQQGIPWHKAHEHASTTAQETILADFDPSEIHPKGNVREVMQQLVDANIRVAVITSDDRQMTEATLSYLGVKDIISAVVCGDDPVKNKPAPDAMHLVASQLGVPTNRIMMVGDTISDMKFALNAGAAFRVGVASTLGNAALLAAQADTIVSSIDELDVKK